jgi:nitronate monooxygenase
MNGTDFTRALGVEYPIVQAPMLGVSTPGMAAIVSDLGGLGSLPIGGLGPDAARALIRKTKNLTAKPFAVNLFAHDIPALRDEDLEPMRRFLIGLAERRGYRLEAEDLAGFELHRYQEQVDVLLEEGVSIVSFTFGCLDETSARRLKAAGCILIGTATCLEEALALRDRGIDMVSAQGIEAGGHRGTFLDSIPLPQVGLFALLPRIKRETGLPCIAAGGIRDGATMAAAFRLGADAVQIGTPFIATAESEAIPAYKRRLETARDTDTALTRSFSGRWARGLRNRMMDEIETSGIAVPPYPWQNALTAKLRRLAQRNDDAEHTNLWAGQAAQAEGVRGTRDVFMDLVAGLGEGP